MKKSFKRGFVSLIGMLIAAVIILYLSLLLLSTYFKVPLVDKEQKDFFAESGIDTSHPAAVMEGVKSKIKDIEQQQKGYEKEIEGFR